MSCNTHDHINKTIAEIKALREIRKKLDPACGMALNFRRGVARDNDEYEDDATRRPWVLVELGGSSDGGMEALESIIDTAVKLKLSSLKLWMNFAQQDIKNLNMAYADATYFLQGEK
jgi:hypothetical protein